MMFGFGMAITSPQVLAHPGASTPGTPDKIAIESCRAALGGTSLCKASISTCSFQPAATGILTIKLRTWPGLVQVGVTRVSNDGNPVAQTVAISCAYDSTYVFDMTIDATDGWYLDEPTVLRYGPVTTPPYGLSSDVEIMEI
jgi:hypothetical protein